MANKYNVTALVSNGVAERGTCGKMNTPDEFSLYHDDLLEGDYDCVDRMVLNTYFPLGQTGGLRNWWRQLRGDDSTLDDAYLRELAGTFSRRLNAFGNKQSIPISDDMDTLGKGTGVINDTIHTDLPGHQRTTISKLDEGMFLIHQSLAKNQQLL